MADGPEVAQAARLSKSPPVEISKATSYTIHKVSTPRFWVLWSSGRHGITAIKTPSQSDLQCTHTHFRTSAHRRCTKCGFRKRGQHL